MAKVVSRFLVMWIVAAFLGMGGLAGWAGAEETEYVLKKSDQFFGTIISGTEEKYLLGPGDYVVTDLGTVNKKVRTGGRFHVFQLNPFVPKDNSGRRFFERLAEVEIVKSFDEKSVARIIRTKKELNFLLEETFYMDPVDLFPAEGVPLQERDITGDVPPIGEDGIALREPTEPPFPSEPAAPLVDRLPGEREAYTSPEDRFLRELVHFAFDDSGLTTEAMIALKFKARFLLEQPQRRVLIEGHCDERGSVEYNLALGQRRAESVRQYLLDLGVSPDRIRSVSYGKERPIDSAHSEEAWARNRRCEFRLDPFPVGNGDS